MHTASTQAGVGAGLGAATRRWPGQPRVGQACAASDQQAAWSQVRQPAQREPPPPPSASWHQAQRRLAAAERVRTTIVTP